MSNSETSIPRKWIYLFAVSVMGFIGWVFRDINGQLKDCNNANRKLVESSIEYRLQLDINDKLNKIKDERKDTIE